MEYHVFPGLGVNSISFSMSTEDIHAVLGYPDRAFQDDFGCHVEVYNREKMVLVYADEHDGENLLQIQVPANSSYLNGVCLDNYTKDKVLAFLEVEGEIIEEIVDYGYVETIVLRSMIITLEFGVASHITIVTNH